MTRNRDEPVSRDNSLYRNYHSHIAVAVKWYISAEYGVAFNPWATFSRPMNRYLDAIDRTRLAGTMLRCGYAAEALRALYPEVMNVNP